MPTVAHFLASGLSVLSPLLNGTSLGSTAPGMVPQYSLIRHYSTSDCSGTPEAVIGYAVNQCFKNSYVPGTYDYRCDGDNICDTYMYSTADCSGDGKAKGSPIINNGKCQFAGVAGYVEATIKIGGSAVKAALTGPSQASWHTGDSTCTGAPSTFEDLGLCRSVGVGSYRLQCSSEKKVEMCQYLNSTTCTGFQRCSVQSGYNPTDTCITRKHFGGAASVQFECK